MESSLSFIISDISFDLGRFKPIFNDCFILRDALCQIHESLQCRFFSDYSSVVGFVQDTLKKIDCPFRFSLRSIHIDAPVASAIEYTLVKVSIRVS